MTKHEELIAENILLKAAREAVEQLQGIDHESEAPKIQDTPTWREGNAMDILREAIERIMSFDRKDLK